jgi:prepilin-type N-terminal cleavage/methylation domain-containing protein
MPMLPIMPTRACPHRRSRVRPAFTLFELILSLAILGVLLTATTGTVVRATREQAAQRKNLRSEQALQAAELTLSRLLRGARADVLRLGIAGIDVNPLVRPTWDNVRLRSDMNPADGDIADPLEDVLVYVSADTLLVRWQAGTAAQPVAYPIRSVLFEFFTADGAQVIATPIGSTVTRARFTLNAPSGRDPAVLLQRRTWVTLRN